MFLVVIDFCCKDTIFLGNGKGNIKLNVANPHGLTTTEKSLDMRDLRFLHHPYTNLCSFFSSFPCFLGERTPKARQRKRILPLKLWEYPLKIKLINNLCVNSNETPLTLSRYSWYQYYNSLSKSSALTPFN